MDQSASVAASALSALSMKQAVTANNIANADTPGYKASTVQAGEVLKGGVTASVVRTEDPVDISKEAANLLVNSALYKANVATVKTADEMAKSLFDIKA